ncbi:MAG: polyprenyl glycosylphosphotransferase [Citromicrobium sp.]|nr:MAG: polyprenyl glycosylphosphotransferase [Citromicrobium sp.]
MVKMNRHMRRRGGVLGAGSQIFLGLIICVALPFALYVVTSPISFQDGVARPTALLAAVSVIFGFWLNRSVSALPGTSESEGIVPSYLMSFGLVLVIVLMARIDYSRVILSSSFVLSIAWFYLVYVVTQRRAVLHLGIVDGGRVEPLFDLRNVTAFRLSPDDRPLDLDAVSADFRFPHSAEWEARLADYVLTGIPVYHSKTLLESLTGRCEVEHLSENTFGTLGPLPPLQKAKRAIDWFLALIAIILLAPLLAVVALLIRADSPGPALFRQDRVGYRGRIFQVYKFRTMRCDTGLRREGRAQFITMENDPRITRLGKILRKTRVDELPQIWNVLRGEMSWIGPRPEAAALSDWYTREIPFYRYRHVVYPGITGWAQVSQGHVAEVNDVKQKLEYDFFYIRNFSVWLDLLIIAKTLRTVMTGFGHR